MALLYPTPRRDRKAPERDPALVEVFDEPSHHEQRTATGDIGRRPVQAGEGEDLQDDPAFDGICADLDDHSGHHEHLVAMLVAELEVLSKHCAYYRRQLAAEAKAKDDAVAEHLAAKAELLRLRDALTATEAESLRLRAENELLMSKQCADATEMVSLRSLLQATMEESGRNRRLLQQHLHSQFTFDARHTTAVDAAHPRPVSPTRHDAIAAPLPRRTFSPPRPVVTANPHDVVANAQTTAPAPSPPPQRPLSPATTLAGLSATRPVTQNAAPQQMLTSPVPAWGSGPSGGPSAIQLRRQASASAQPSSSSIMPQSPTVAAVRRAVIPADPVFSTGVALSQEGHVCVCTGAQAQGLCFYGAAATLGELAVEAHIRSSAPGDVVMGITAFIGGDSVSGGVRERVSVRCDGSVSIVCGPSGATEAQFVPTRVLPHSALQPGKAFVVQLRWAPSARELFVSIDHSMLTVQPIKLPDAFGLRDLCPFVLLPRRGDEVVLRLV